MTETGFGSGGYAYTLATIPSAPLLEEHTATSIRLTIGPDDNQTGTRYAIENLTDGTYVGADGSPEASPVWLTRTEWDKTDVTGLEPSTLYSFRAYAMNAEDIVTEPGPTAEVLTINAGNIELGLTLTVTKTSSTIAAPVFMRSLPTCIRIAGKDLHEMGFVTDRITGLNMPRVRVDEELVPGGHSWRVWDEYFAPKHIVIEGHLHASSDSDLQLRLAYLKSFLATFAGIPWRSTAPVRLQRNDVPGRFWNAYYERLEEIEPLGKTGRASSARITITLKCPEPFALDEEVTRAVSAPDADDFIILDLGNAPSEAVYAITGPTTNPSFTVGDMVCHCDFADGLAYRNEENDTMTAVYTPSANEADAWRLTATGMGILSSGTDTISYSCKGNRTDSAWVVAISPTWQSSLRNTDAVILEHRYDAGNYLRLYWDTVADAWVFRKRSNGIDHEVVSPRQAFTADTRIILGITCDGTNAGGMKLFVDGLPVGIGTDTTALSGAPGILTLHAGDGTMQPDTVFDMVAGWSRMLSADEMVKIASDPGAVRNLNATISYTGILNTGDVLTLDSAEKTARLFDRSTGIRTNVLDKVDGDIPILTPGRRRTATDRTQTVLYAKTASTGLEIRYTRRYL